MFFFTTLMIRNTIQERTKIKDGPEYQLMEYIHQNPMRSWVIKKTGFITIMAISDLVRFGELRHSETLFDQIIGCPRIGYLEKVIDGAKSFNAEKKWINELKNWQNKL